MTDDAFDAQFQVLVPVEPSAQVVSRTLAAYRSERRRDAFRVRGLAVVGMLGMAAMAMLVVREGEATGNPASMVERGAGPVLPAVDLKVAVVSPTGDVARFAPGDAYTAGTTIRFRVTSTAPTTLTLRRDDAVLWTGPVGAGTADLPVGYTLEAGELAAVFTLEGGAETLRFPLRAVRP